MISLLIILSPQQLSKKVKQEPEYLEWRLQLAYLYKLTNQLSKAEAVYDHILTQQKNNLQALIGKATLRKLQGDLKTAEALLTQAEKAAPSELKAQVRAMAQNTLTKP